MKSCKNECRLHKPTQTCEGCGRTIDEIIEAGRVRKRMKLAEVITWANKRGILANSTPQAQFTKMVEEVGEIAECISKGKSGAIKTEIGDLVVTAILLAKLYDYSLEECLDSAYEKISKRNGTVVDGIFIKDEDGNV